MSQSRTLPGLAEELAAIRASLALENRAPDPDRARRAYPHADGREPVQLLRQQLSWACQPPQAHRSRKSRRSIPTASAWPPSASSAAPAICTRELESRIATYVGMEDSILFAACFDANGGVFEPLFGDKDAIISDSLNHASIIDGIRLSKAARYRYANGDMDDLETQLKAAREKGARRVVIVTDGVFSMDGYFADLVSIRALADRYDALIMVDDCHATGFIGPKGAGTPARAGVKVDILTGTLGKALGGSMGGYIAASKDIVDLMRQRARPYLFSNALPPAITAAGIAAIDLAENGDKLREKLFANAKRFRTSMTKAGFNLLPGEHPIIPVMLGEAKLAQDMASRLHELGIFVTGFFFPVVPQGKARIRTQMSAAHSTGDIDAAVAAFTKAGKELGVI